MVLPPSSHTFTAKKVAPQGALGRLAAAFCLGLAAVVGLPAASLAPAQAAQSAPSAGAGIFEPAQHS